MEAMYEPEYDYTLTRKTWLVYDRKILSVCYVGEQLTPILTKRKTSRLIVQNMQINQMLLTMATLMITTIVYPGKKGQRFVLSHN